MGHFKIPALVLAREPALPADKRTMKKTLPADGRLWLEHFCSPAREEILLRSFQNLELSYTPLKRRSKTHYYLSRKGTGARPVVLLAHWDRVAGSPGANDNGASVFHLLNFLTRESPSRNPLHIFFTDGEELGPGDKPLDQGVAGLGEDFSALGLREAFFVVLDMTGIGDSLVLGRSSRSAFEDRGLTPPLELDHRLEHDRGEARRVLSTLDSRGVLELPTPFSDDLGLLALGLPAVQISVLPRPQALAWKKDPRRFPPAWNTMHTPEDTPQTLDPRCFPLVARFLDALGAFPLRSWNA